MYYNYYIVWNWTLRANNCKAALPSPIDTLLRIMECKTMDQKRSKYKVSDKGGYSSLPFIRTT